MSPHHSHCGSFDRLYWCCSSAYSSQYESHVRMDVCFRGCVKNSGGGDLSRKAVCSDCALRFTQISGRFAMSSRYESASCWSVG